MTRADRGTIKYSMLFALVTVVWGLGFPVSHQVIQTVPPFTMLFLRFSIGGLTLYIFHKLKREAKITREEMLCGLKIGAVCFVAFVFQSFGVKYTSPAKNGMIIGMHVIFLPIVLCITQRKLNLKAFFDALLCLLGMTILFEVFRGEFSANLGDLFSVIGALCFAFHFMAVEKYSKECRALALTVCQLITVAALSGIFSLCLETGQYHNIIWNFSFIWQMLFLAVMCTSFAYVIQTLVQSKVASATTSIIACLEGVFGAIFSIIMGYDKLTLSFVLGAIIITASMLSSVMLGKKGQARKSSDEIKSVQE